MSRRSRARRKLARRNYRSCREAPRLLLASDAGAGPGYPRLHELLASGPAWRELLETTLRSVLRPAAIVSAVGLAGCGAQSHVASLAADTTTVESSAAASGPGAVLVPMPPVGPDGRVVVGALPPPPAHVGPTVPQTAPVPPLHRPPPGILHGAPSVPVPHPMAVRGEMTAVEPQPLPPAPEPIAAPGGGSVVQPSS